MQKPLFLNALLASPFLIIPVFHADAARPHEVALPVVIDGPLKVVIEGREVDLVSTPGMPNAVNISSAFAVSIFGPQATTWSEDDQAGRSLKLALLGLESVHKNRKSTIGPITTNGLAREAKLGLDGPIYQGFVEWYENAFIPGKTAAAGPYALPYPIIDYRLRPSTGAEVTVELPLAPENTRWLAGAAVKFDKTNVFFHFAPQFPRSVASAAAASIFASRYVGRF
jgi:hypothetical protein